MPNYVKNIVSFSGKEAEICKMLDAIKGDDTLFDFNKVIPMPQSLDIESSSTLKNSFIVYRYLNWGLNGSEFYELIQRHKKPHERTQLCVKRLEKEGLLNMELGKTASDNYSRYGYTDWYYWCVHNWGTKWNACDCEIYDNQLDFDTAWSAPHPVIEKLARSFPEISFTHKWADEDVGCNTGCREYMDGVLTYESLPSDCSEEAYGLYEVCWGTELSVSACVE